MNSISPLNGVWLSDPGTRNAHIPAHKWEQYDYHHHYLFFFPAATFAPDLYPAGWSEVSRDAAALPFPLGRFRQWKERALMLCYTWFSRTAVPFGGASQDQQNSHCFVGALSPLATLKQATVELSHANSHPLLFHKPCRVDLWSRYDFASMFQTWTDM